MNDWLDTILNINVFAFIGLLTWLYLKPCALEQEELRPAEVAVEEGGEDETGTP